jgi:hypothetical protein
MFKNVVACLLLAELISLGGCIPLVKEPTGDYALPEKDQAISTLNGQNYENPVTVGPVVILEKKKHEQTIMGDVKYQTDLMALPAKFIKLQLTRGEKIIQEIQTDVEGHFIFRGSFPEGDYLIKIKSNLQEPGFKVSVAKSDVVDLVLLINKK